MKGIFVNEDGGIRYAQAIVQGYKPIETRSRNMLSACVGERVAIIRTRKGKSPMVVGYASIPYGYWMPQDIMNGETMRSMTCIPAGSQYDSGPNGKWCYHMADPEECQPYPLPTSAVRHGRSWCEF